MQMTSVGTARVRGTLGNRGEGDYALLNVDRIEYISLVINAFEIFFNFFLVDVCS